MHRSRHLRTRRESCLNLTSLSVLPPSRSRLLWELRFHNVSPHPRLSSGRLEAGPSLEQVTAAILECLRLHFGYLAKESLAIDSSRTLLANWFLWNRSASSGDAQGFERPSLTFNVAARMKLSLKSLILGR